MNLPHGELHALLESLVDIYNRPSFIENDPIQIPHRYQEKSDIEVSGFFAALLAWGGRKAIIQAALRLMELMDDAPADFITNHQPSDLKRFEKFVYRTLQPDDTLFLIAALQTALRKYGSMEQLFLAGWRETDTDLYGAITFVRNELLKTPHLPRSRKHLANPDAGSAAKRIHLYLRWMVRSDNRGVDFGFWKQIRPNQLVCPLDIHTGNAARELGLLSRKANDRTAALELTNLLKQFDPVDPVKYDFALFGYGKRIKEI
jgi:uncharacterized protein (TIGR02757 family)